MYQLLPQGTGVVRLDDNAFIPLDPGNADYVQYLAWLAQGNQPLPAVLPRPQDIAIQLLAQLEQASLMNRLTREFMLVSMQDMAQRQAEIMATQNIITTPQAILAKNIGWQKLVAIDAQASQLRIEADNA